MRRRKSNVLVCVLKDKRDLHILLKEKWYRIPKSFLPKRKFTHLAFYQPASFGRHGKRIQYYARVLKDSTAKRIDLLPKEKNHPRAHNAYLKIEVVWIKRLARQIENIVPRRVSFGFTTLKSLLKAGDILELYGVAPTEQIIERGLDKLGIKTEGEVTISKEGKRYRIDLAVFCRDGRIAIECDNRKAHSGAQLGKDKLKDKFLRRNGWHVIRLSEHDIVERLDYCLGLVAEAVEKLGGQDDIMQK
jgi:very-short-patch-repair endonuclease